MKLKFPVVPTLYKIVIIVSLLVFFSILLVNYFIKIRVFEGLDASGSTTLSTDASGSSVDKPMTDASGSSVGKPMADSSGSTITVVPKPNSQVKSTTPPSPSDSSANIITDLQIAQERAKTDKAQADAQTAQAKAQAAQTEAQSMR